MAIIPQEKEDIFVLLVNGRLYDQQEV